MGRQFRLLGTGGAIRTHQDASDDRRLYLRAGPVIYRVHHKFAHTDVAVSAGVQYRVRSDLGASGVMFTLDTDSDFRDVVFIASSYGLGETVVQGAVNPDEYYLHKAGLAADQRCVLQRNLGAKAIKMIYAEGGSDNGAAARGSVHPTRTLPHRMQWPHPIVGTVYPMAHSTPCVRSSGLERLVSG